LFDEADGGTKLGGGIEVVLCGESSNGCSPASIEELLEADPAPFEVIRSLKAATTA